MYKPAENRKSRWQAFWEQTMSAVEALDYDPEMVLYRRNDELQKEASRLRAEIVSLQVFRYNHPGYE